ncbi:helix-turn-helix domain-containing protein [Isoptericola sp. b441]|uniref:Helix-turn-helix domain-containing protein n=1 Tax=Actinotalea lenta TaxID=3064654 RepID=A0ABT9D863_9CELL|nr:TetR/AcrR family transcriptional regulator [Isoptericola sp. b441]MDO8107069.1 helix-turn-helix domain-containing protein [Isoptericola sp. b441]
MADDESVASAARALADATAALTKLLGQQMGAVSDDVGRAVSQGLREASRGLDQASESISGHARAGDRRRERAEETRTELLDAAARVIASRGYEGASVGDVAGAAGYTKGAVYSNFGSKEDLFRALAERELAEHRVAPRPGDAPVTAEQALLNLEILAAMNRSSSLGALLADDFARAVREATGAGPDREPTQAELDRAVAHLALTTIAPLVEVADPTTAGATHRLTTP